MYGKAGAYTPGVAGVPVLATTGAPAVVWMIALAVLALGAGMLMVRSSRLAKASEVRS
ncbi:hypothetical protein [Cellulosimicrobium sp. NPDC057862]|uniref:hypothetical protein n=1 Tax=Cellulosimicrobium sp. NPDC057862 TaxID=3346266 RepID=UPI00366C078B